MRFENLYIVFVSEDMQYLLWIYLRRDQDAFWCFTLNRLNGLKLPAEVSFHSFIMGALKGPVMFGKV